MEENEKMEKDGLWKSVLAKIELEISRPTFLTWFQDTGISQIDDGVAVITVPNAFAKEWLQNKYHKTILHFLRVLAPEVKELSYSIKKNDGPRRYLHHRSARKQEVSAGNIAEEMLAINALTVDPETNLNPKYTFESFVVGSFNELAHAAAQSILKNPGRGFNPLFIYGGVGLGKTHLIQALGNELIRQNPKAVVRYVPAEKYMVEIVDAVKNQEMNKIKEKYRGVDLLIMDDIQFIGKTEKIQEEFFHTFNSLQNRDRQIIISSDRPPQAISTLEERLRSRFEGGTVVDIGLPDYETRLLILRTKSESRKINIPEEVLEYIASNIKNNIRELEGALNKIIVTAKLSNAPINLEASKKALSNHLSLPKKFVSAKKIVKAVSDFYEIPEEDLVTQSRKKDLVKPRQIAMYLLREELKSSYPSIGERLGGRDHTTVIHSCEKIGKELLLNRDLEEEIKAIKDRVLSD